jgi:multiple sugar transport system permease protein
LFAESRILNPVSLHQKEERVAVPTEFAAPGRGVAQPKAASVRVGRTVSTLAKYGLLLFFAGFFLLPWAWMISTSLKNPEELAVYPIIWIPDPIRWDNYLEAFRRAEFPRFLLNTLLVTFPSVIGALLSNALVGYGFARVRWPGRDFVFSLVLATLILPGFVTFIPLYLIFKQLNWINSYLPLIVPTFFANPFFVFMLRQFFMTLPEELADAARVDGASEWRIFWQIILPLSRSSSLSAVGMTILARWSTSTTRRSTPSRWALPTCAPATVSPTLPGSWPQRV